MKDITRHLFSGASLNHFVEVEIRLAVDSFSEMEDDASQDELNRSPAVCRHIVGGHDMICPLLEGSDANREPCREEASNLIKKPNDLCCVFAHVNNMT